MVFDRYAEVEAARREVEREVRAGLHVAGQPTVVFEPSLKSQVPKHRTYRRELRPRRGRPLPPLR